MSDQEVSGEKFEQWAIVDVMGHQQYVGFVTDYVIAGKGFVRIDVPEADGVPAWCKFIGTNSIYAITPVSEQIARHMAKRNRSLPVPAYQMPQLAIADAGDDEDEYPI